MINYIKTSIPYYKRMLQIAIPIMVQSGITNFVALLDNIMVGRVGTLEMSGVSIVNQLFMVFNLCIFGVMSGAGIFTAQYHGKEDSDGVKASFQYKLLASVIVSLFGTAIFLLFGDFLISLYLQGEGSKEDLLLVSQYARKYLNIMLIGAFPFALSNAYAGTLKETTDRIVPMIATVSAVFVNLVFNYLLIFGKLGFPELGVNGAAIATVLSRFVELGILALWSHTHKKKYPFIKQLYTKFYLTKEQIKKITVIASPLVLNETLWAAGMAVLNQCYSYRGLTVIASLNITSTISNLFNVTFISFGSAIGIILSQTLGAGKKDEAKFASTRLVWGATAISTVIGVTMVFFAELFPKIYNTEEAVRTLATSLITVAAIYVPVHAFLNACYFSLRSGGKTVITFIFDSGYLWLISFPIAFCLSRFTDINVVAMYCIVSAADIIKCALGYIFLKKGKWLNTVVE